MSNQVNTDLMERAAEVKTYYESTVLEDAIDNCIKQNDLEMLEYLVSGGEEEIARQDEN